MEIRTCCIDKLRIMLACKQWIWQIPEELLQKTSDAVDVMIKGVRIAEVDF